MLHTSKTHGLKRDFHLLRGDVLLQCSQQWCIYAHCWSRVVFLLELMELPPLLSASAQYGFPYEQLSHKARISAMAQPISPCKEILGLQHFTQLNKAASKCCTEFCYILVVCLWALCPYFLQRCSQSWTSQPLQWAALALG